MIFGNEEYCLDGKKAVVAQSSLNCNEKNKRKDYSVYRVSSSLIKKASRSVDSRSALFRGMGQAGSL